MYAHPGDPKALGALRGPAIAQSIQIRVRAHIALINIRVKYIIG